MTNAEKVVETYYEVLSQTGSHQLARLGNKTSVFPNHGSKEIGTGLVQKIKKT
jgi:predicted RNA binding protein YcfA (HicA-like mRNA interferase family)